MSREVALPKSIFSRRNPESNNGRRRVMDLLIQQSDNIQGFSKFKVEPSFMPDHSEVRRIAKACASCFPNQAAHLDEEVVTSGIRDILHYRIYSDSDSLRREERWYKWDLFTGPKSVARLPLLTKQGILKEAKDALGDDDGGEKKTILEKLSKDIWLPFQGSWGKNWVLRFTGWVLKIVFRRVFGNICVHGGEVTLLERALMADLPVIYVPSFKSDWDSAVLFYALQTAGFSTPYFFSSGKQRYWDQYIGGIGFNPQVKYNSKEKPLKDNLSMACFRNLMKQRAGFTLRLEQQRSRCGKSSTEFYGFEILKILHECWKNNDIEDAYIVPVSISYENVPEMSVDGGFQRPVSLFRLFCSGSGSLGNVRVSFAQPFTLREFEVATQSNTKFKALLQDLDRKEPLVNESYMRTYTGQELSWDSNLDPELSCSLSSIYGMIDLGSNERLIDEINGIFLDSLMFHAAYASSQSCTIMSTNLVAFLLLKKIRNSEVTFDNLVKDVCELSLRMKSCDRDVGFSGSAEKAVMLALNLLGPETLSVKRNANGDVMISPVLSKQGITKLGYYSSIIMGALAMESIVAITIFTLLGNKTNLALGFEELDKEIRVDHTLLVKEARKVYDTMSSEFFLHTPCISANAAIGKACQSLVDRNLLASAVDDGFKKSYRNYDDDYYEEDDEDDQPAIVDEHFAPYNYKIVTSDDSFATLCFLKNLLTPLLEVYADILKQLFPLISKLTEGKKEEELAKQIIEKLKQNFPFAQYGEFLSVDVVKTALLMFSVFEIVRYDVTPGGPKTIMLGDRYQTEFSLKRQANNILHFVTY